MSLTRANMRAAECSTRALRWTVGIRIPAVDRGVPAAPNLAANCDNAAMGKKKPDKDKANGGGTVALNKRARHEYHLEERFRSEEHTSELQSLMSISYAVFCLKKKTLSDQDQIHDTKRLDHMKNCPI